MSRNSKAKRDAKKKRLKKRKAKLVNQNKTVQQDEGPVFSSMENPFANLSDDDRAKVINEIASKSIEKLPSKVDELSNIFKSYSPICILSIVSSYSLTQGIGDDGIVNRESSIRGTAIPCRTSSSTFLKARD